MRITNSNYKEPSYKWKLCTKEVLAKLQAEAEENSPLKSASRKQDRKDLFNER